MNHPPWPVVEVFERVASLLPVELRGSAGRAHCLNGHYAVLRAGKNPSLVLALDHPPKMSMKRTTMRWAVVV